MTRRARAAWLAILATTVSTAALAQGAPVTDRVLVTGLKPAGATAEPGGQLLRNAPGAAGALPSLGDFLERNAAGVTVSTPQGNPFQPELSYRGYSVSGLLGLPQGLAFYQNGARINEAFGDTVNFDLVPEVAIDTISIAAGANPLFGLNALGGAVATTMKTGFTFEGVGAEATAGSFDRVAASGETGWNDGTNGLYAAASWFDEDGWREHSPSSLMQLYGDASRRIGRGEIGVSVTYADSDLNGNGAAPVELLYADRDAVFTYPDNTQNELLFIQGRGDFAISDTLTLETGAYHRRFRQDTLNGDETDIDECSNGRARGLRDLLCSEDGDGDPIEDINGNRISEDDAGDDPFGLYNRSGTDTNATGVTGQFVLRPAAGMLTEFTFGAAYDTSDTDFESSAEIGELTADRTVEGSSIILGGDEFQTGLDAESQFWGLYAGAAFALTDRLSVELSGRYNTADVDLIDQIGTALTGSHEFERFNPGIEATYVIGNGVTAFGRYAESNRTPTPAELSCADETQPCRFPNAFVADPPLEQVVSKSWEGGFTGGSEMAGGVVDWSLTAFTATNHDDIIFVSSGPVVGSGYFRNAGDTRRQGAEAFGRWSNAAWSFAASYSYIDAEFRDALTLRADDNPNADALGEIHVTSGDRIPLIPKHSAQFNAEWRFMPAFAADVTLLASSNRVFRGDEANDGERLAGFIRMDAGLSANVGRNARLFVRVENVLDQDYETFGTYGDTSEVFLQEAPLASDPRFVTPGAPRAVFGGVRVSF